MGMTKSVHPPLVSTWAKSNTVSFLLGFFLLVVLAKIAIPLPWTPVPITGQTFGVALLALLWGARQSSLIVASYVAAGFFGAPFLATVGLQPGPTTGYLVGMWIAPWVIEFAMKAQTGRSVRAFALAAGLGHAVIYVFGLLGLFLFMPNLTGASLLQVGLWPFLFGDLLKILLVATLVKKLFRISERT
jgi:biotin transport system substrate-specific component